MKAYVLWFLFMLFVAGCNDTPTADDTLYWPPTEVTAGTTGAAGRVEGEVAGSAPSAAGAAGAAGGGIAGADDAGRSGAAGAAGSADSSGAGAGAAGAAGVAGAAGSVSSAGSGGASGTAGAAAGSGGSAGAVAGSGGGGADGSLPPYACPLGATDANANGYPDACETVLATIDFDTTGTGITADSTAATASYYTFARALSPADSATYPDCDPAVNTVGQEYPVHPGVPETRIFDVRTNVQLQRAIACEKKFLAHPSTTSKLSGLWTQLLYNVHSDWQHDRSGAGSNFWTNSTINATLTPTFTIVYAKREVISYAPTSYVPYSDGRAYINPHFVGRWTLHGYRTPK